LTNSTQLKKIFFICVHVFVSSYLLLQAFECCLFAMPSSSTQERLHPLLSHHQVVKLSVAYKQETFEGHWRLVTNELDGGYFAKRPSKKHSDLRQLPKTISTFRRLEEWFDRVKIMATPLGKPVPLTRVSFMAHCRIEVTGAYIHV
jgi:hypothetical protein